MPPAYKSHCPEHFIHETYLLIPKPLEAVTLILTLQMRQLGRNQWGGPPLARLRTYPRGSAVNHRLWQGLSPAGVRARGSARQSPGPVWPEEANVVLGFSSGSLAFPIYGLATKFV